MLVAWRAVATATALCAFAIFPAASAAHAQVPQLQPELARHFRRDLDALVAGSAGVVGIAIEDLTSGERFAINDSLAFPTASAIKVPLLLELLRQTDAGILRLDERVEVRKSDQVAGDGVSQFFTDGGSALALRDLAVLMSTLSDNTATNILIARVGMARVNALLDTLGLPDIRLRRLMMHSEESARGNENVATPRSAAKLMTRFARCELPMRRPACEEAHRILALPKRGTVSDVLPAGVPVAWKPGTLDGVSTAFAHVELRGRPYVMAIMVAYAGNQADDIVRSVVRLTHGYFTRIASTTPYGVRIPGTYDR